MSQERRGRIDREGIHIERDLADSEAIEEELDANILGPYRFPEPSRRRVAGWVFVAGAAIAAVVIDGGWIPALGFLALAFWQFASSWPLDIREEEAMSIAGRAVGFPVGHASAAVTFGGWRSRPRWSVVLYSAAEPPDQRALVVLDAVTGELISTPYTEEIPSV